jgi:hypothetical protein
LEYRVNKRIYLRTTVKNLFALSGNRCAWPGCSERIVCLESGKVFGEICHIRSGATDGPRYDPDYPLEKINKPENLLLMCPPHHKDIDSDDGIYPTAAILDMKTAHQVNMRSQLELPEKSAEYFATLLEQLKYTYRPDPQLSDLVLRHPVDHDEHVVTAIMANAGGSPADLVDWSVQTLKGSISQRYAWMPQGGKLRVNAGKSQSVPLIDLSALLESSGLPKEEWKFLSVSKIDGGRELNGPHYQFIACAQFAIHMQFTTFYDTTINQTYVAWLNVRRHWENEGALPRIISIN